MSQSGWQNEWLHSRIQNIGGVALEPSFDPVIRVNAGSKDLAIYTPNSDEYIVTVDLVALAKDFGANILSYPSWCMASVESRKYGASIGVNVISHSDTLKLLEDAASS